VQEKFEKNDKIIPGELGVYAVYRIPYVVRRSPNFTTFTPP
jgi:hypothetical protein